MNGKELILCRLVSFHFIFRCLVFFIHKSLGAVTRRLWIGRISGTEFQREYSHEDLLLLKERKKGSRCDSHDILQEKLNKEQGLLKRQKEDAQCFLLSLLSLLLS